MLYQMLGQEKRSDTGGMPKLPAFFMFMPAAAPRSFPLGLPALSAIRNSQ